MLDQILTGLVPQYNWDNIPERELRPGVTQKVFRGDNVVVGLTTLHPGMQTSPHSHPYEQIFMIGVQPGLRMPLGSRCSAYVSSPMTTVWPALLPPLNLTT